MKAHINAPFWSDERAWPYDQPGQPGYVFLLRAVQEVGSAMFPGEWTGQEFRGTQPTELPPWHNANEDDHQRADALLRSHPNEPQSKPVLGDIYSNLRPIVGVRVGVDVDHRPNERYEAARELSCKLLTDAAPGVARFETTIAKIAEWLRSGELISALRPASGGAMGQSLTPDWWQTERWMNRFFVGKTNLRDRFRNSLGSPNDEWIFLTRQSLNKCLRSLLPIDRTLSVETRATNWLCTLMHESPHERPQGVTKNTLRLEAKEKFGIGEFVFNRVWGRALRKTGAKWNKPGAPRKSHR
jgi:hypothetical protein